MKGTSSNLVNIKRDWIPEIPGIASCEHRPLGSGKRHILHEGKYPREKQERNQHPPPLSLPLSKYSISFTYSIRFNNNHLPNVNK